MSEFELKVEEFPLVGLSQLERCYENCLLCYEGLYPCGRPFLARVIPLDKDIEGRLILKNKYFGINWALARPLRSSPKGNFLPSFEDPRIFATTAAYYLSKAISFCLQRFRYTLGYTLKVEFTEDWEPQHDFQQGILRLFTGGGVVGLGPCHHLTLYPQPISPMVVAHEFAHFLFWELVDRKSLRPFVAGLQKVYVGGWMRARELLESRAVQEGFCDYLAASIFEDPNIIPELPLRNLADESFIAHRLALLPQLRGWGQFLWQIRQRWEDKAEADRVVFLSLQFWDQEAGLQGAAEALKRAAGRLMGRSHSYRKVVEEVAAATQLLEPPLPAELKWEVRFDNNCLQVRGPGRFHLMSNLGGVIFSGSCQRRSRLTLPTLSPLAVYSLAPNTIYLGKLLGKRLLISSDLSAWEAPKYSWDPSIQLMKSREDRPGIVFFQVRWRCPHRPAVLFLLKSQAAGEFVPQAEPIPLGRGFLKVLWGARYIHVSLGKERYLELEVPALSTQSAQKLICIVRAQTPQGMVVESSPLSLT